MTNFSQMPQQPLNAPRRQIVMASEVGVAHTDDWSEWITCGDTVDEWIITVYANDVLVQFAPLNNPDQGSPPIKRRVGESGRDRQKRKGIGLIRVKSLTPGANGTFDLEVYS